MDSGGAEHAMPWIERANPTHPSLIDQRHQLGELFGVVNVPAGIWIDEDGIIVRPPEPAWPGKSMFREIMANIPIPEDGDPYVIKALTVTREIVVDPEASLERLRDWVANGSASQYAMSPEEVVERSRPRAVDHAVAAAHFELGQRLYRDGAEDDAIAHFKEAHRLHPENWTYKRQAWNLASPLLQNARDVYGTDWASEVAAAGASEYYRGLFVT